MKPFLTCSPLPHPLHRNAIRPLHQQPHRRWIWAIYAALKPSKIVRERQLPDLGVEGFDVDRRRAPLGLFRPEHPGSPFEEQRLPGRDLVRTDVELLRQLGQRLLALDGGQSHLCFESRAVVPARSSRHRLSCSRAILAALRQKLHSSACPNLLSQLSDGWRGYLGLPAEGYDHEPINLGATWDDAALRLPAIHLVFSLAKRWLLGTHHGAVSEKHLPAYLDEYVFRFNRRTATLVSHGFARLIEQAVKTRPATYREITATPA